MSGDALDRGRHYPEGHTMRRTPAAAICLLAVGLTTCVAERRSPGAYHQKNACAQFAVYNTKIDWCVDTLVLGKDSMTVWCSWRGHGMGVQHGSDSSNRNMFLTDGFGTRLDHISTSGLAKDGGVIDGKGDAKMGSYTFRAPRRGAFIFTFHDDDEHVTIPNIRLDPANYSANIRGASLLGGVTNATEVVIDDEESGLGGSSSTHGTLTRQDGAAFGSLLRLLAEAPVLPGPYHANIVHTDDYPNVSIRVKTATEEFHFHSDSQGQDHIPWAVNVNGATYVVPSDAPARALAVAAPYLKTNTTLPGVPFIK
jgi:hypothetical protein